MVYFYLFICCPILVPPSDRDLSPYSIHAIAGVLKLFLRQLKEPLMTFPVYDLIVNIERNAGSDELTTEQLEEYKKGIQMLGNNLPAFEVFIIFFLNNFFDQKIN